MPRATTFVCSKFAGSSMEDRLEGRSQADAHRQPCPSLLGAEQEALTCSSLVVPLGMAMAAKDGNADALLTLAALCLFCCAASCTAEAGSGCSLASEASGCSAAHWAAVLSCTRGHTVMQVMPRHFFRPTQTGKSRVRH